MANLSLEFGNCDASCLAYVLLGTVLGPDFDDYAARLSLRPAWPDLVERHGLDRFKARVYLGFGAGRDISGPGGRCFGAPSTPRSRTATSTMRALPAITS